MTNMENCHIKEGQTCGKPAMQLDCRDFKSEISHCHLAKLRSKAVSADFRIPEPSVRVVKTRKWLLLASFKKHRKDKEEKYEATTSSPTDEMTSLDGAEAADLSLLDDSRWMLLYSRHGFFMFTSGDSTLNCSYLAVKSLIGQPWMW